jgi:hypothetical protein
MTFYHKYPEKHKKRPLAKKTPAADHRLGGSGKTWLADDPPA